MTLTLIAAMAENRVIGKDNRLVWHFPKDLRHFKECTEGHHVIMGRKTYESMMAPLPRRTNIVVTRQKDFHSEGCIVVNSLEAAIAKIAGDDQPFVIGGAQLYQAALPVADKIELTVIHCPYEGDTYFPELDPQQWKLEDSKLHEVDERHPCDFEFRTYVRAHKPNEQ